MRRIPLRFCQLILFLDEGTDGFYKVMERVKFAATSGTAD